MKELFLSSRMMEIFIAMLINIHFLTQANF